MHLPLTIRDHIERAELVFPDRIAMVDEPDQPAASWGSITYRDMAERARAQAAALDQLGVAHGERVAIVSHNSARLLTSFFGVSAYGRVLVPINFRLNADEVAYIVQHSGATVLLIDPELEALLADVRAKHRFVLGSESDRVLYRFGIQPEPWDADENATATINYTSGTTARPKGVQLTHRNLWLNAAVFGWHASVSERETYLHTLPMFHCNGWGMVYSVTAMGGTHIVQRTIDGPEILRRVDQHGVTLMCGAPAVAARLVDTAVKGRRAPSSSVDTRIIVAGAPPPTSTIEAVERELGWELIQIWGLTETAPLLTMNRASREDDGLPLAERAQRRSRAGSPVLGCGIGVSADGELLARGNMIMKGYWDQPEDTAAAIKDGWFHTGDGGIIDDEHQVVISDRKKDVIISGGENISSIEVEDVLFTHPDVAEVAVIGVPDDKWGETVKALIVPVDGRAPSTTELIEYCRSKLAHYKCPTSIELRSALDRTATGKLQKFKLRAPYWKDQQRMVR